MVEKLSFSEKSGYALGDMAANFVFQAMLALQLDFYTHTFGLTAAQAGTLFLVVGLSVACLNPIMGMIADRTSTKWGKFRPWLLWTALPFGIIGVLTFTTPNISPAGKLIYAWTTYILLRIIYTVNNVPYASLTAVMTSDPDERTSIASYRQIAANSAGFIVASLAIPMVRFFGRGDDARGYQYTMGLLSALSVIFFIIAFFATKERIQPNPQQKTSLGQDLADLFKNRPWIVLFLATLFYFTAIVIRGNVMLPYFRYVAGNVDLFSWFNGFGLAALLAGVACSTAVSIRVGKRQLFIASMLLVGRLQYGAVRHSAQFHCGDHRNRSVSPIFLWIVGPHYLGDDGRCGRLRRMENRPPRERYRHVRRSVRPVGRARSRRRHCRLALRSVWLCV
jgi:GPH family glycoside/pentoside/hexuronide:cation symporter